MAGENRAVVERLKLDPMVDVTLSGLGWLMLVCLGNQFFLLLNHYLPATSVVWLSLIGGVAGLVGLVGRKMRRGQHNLPQMLRVVEIGLLAVMTFFFVFGQGWLMYGITLALMILLYQLGYQIAHWSEELLFDFDRLEKKGGWKDGWSGREGLRLYNRHSVGYKGLINLAMTVNGLLVVGWLIGRQVQLWMVWGGGVLFFIQALFLGVAYYQKQRIVWVIQGYQMHPGIVKRMISLLLVVALLITGVGMVLPVKYNPIPWQAVAKWINGLIGGEEFLMQSPPTVEESQPEPIESEGKAKEPLREVVKPSWHTSVFIILITLVGLGLLGVMAGFLISLIHEEAFRLQGFGGVLAWMYLFLKEILLAWIQGIRQGTRVITSKLRIAREQRDQERLERLLQAERDAELAHWTPEDPREEIVFLFVQLLQSLAAKGMGKEDQQTLTEYIDLLATRWPNRRQELQLMQRLLEETVYSRHQVGAEQVDQMRMLIQVFQKQIS